MADDTPTPAPDLNDDIPTPKPMPGWLTGLLAVGGVLAVFGLVTWLIGVGPFAYRTFYYKSAKVYILNMTSAPVIVSVDGGDGWKVGPESSEHKPILGGTSHIVTKTLDGTILDERDVFVDGKPMFYYAGGAQCLVLSDAAGFYTVGAQKQIKLLKTFEAKPTMFELPEGPPIWPRETLRDELKGIEEAVPWVELVACPLIEPDEREMLQATLDILLVERKKRQIQLEKELEIRRRAMYGGDKAVEDYFKDAGLDAAPGVSDVGAAPAAP